MALAIVETERRLPYAPADLCALVADVRAYPSFLPWLKRLDVLRERQEGSVHIALATAEVGWRAIYERFTTEVRTTADQVSVALVSGPFKRLENRWRFIETPAGTTIKFYVAFEFKSPILQTVAMLNRELVGSRLMAAFESEARRRFAAKA
jgi:coenzyme Q-binding protein COQ10